MTRRVVVAAGALLLASSWGCRTATNFPAPDGPRFAGALPGEVPDGRWPDTLLVVSFNIQEGRAVDSALAVFASEAELARPDVVLLQEMDAEGTARLARALDLAWVYYPAAVRTGTGRAFGNAVLSRWPIVDDEKLLLPHLGTIGRMRRTATAATLDVGGVPLRVYSIHLATPFDLGLADRVGQLRAILDDASVYPRVVLGGDFNSAGLPELAEERGFSWPTRDGPGTTRFGRLDHILYRGLGAPPTDVHGTVVDHRAASDHRPVWARAVMR